MGSLMRQVTSALALAWWRRRSFTKSSCPFFAAQCIAVSPAYVSIRPHTSEHVNIRQHISAYQVFVPLFRSPMHCSLSCKYTKKILDCILVPKVGYFSTGTIAECIAVSPASKSTNFGFSYGIENRYCKNMRIRLIAGEIHHTQVRHRYTTRR